MQKKPRSASSFEVEDASHDSKWDDSAEYKLLDDPDVRTKFTPNVIYFDDVRPEETSPKTAKTQAVHHTRNAALQQPNATASTRVFIIISLTFVGCLGAMLAHSTGFTTITPLLAFLSLLVGIPLFFGILRCNVVLIHNLYIGKYIEPFFIFLTIVAAVMFTVMISPSYTGKTFLEFNQIRLGVTLCLLYFIFRLTCRLWIFLFRLEFVCMMSFWVLSLAAYVHALMVHQYPTQGKDDMFLHIFRSWLILIWSALVVYWNANRLRLSSSPYGWIALGQLALAVVVIPALCFEVQDLGSVLYVVDGFLVLVGGLELLVVAVVTILPGIIAGDSIGWVIGRFVWAMMVIGCIIAQAITELIHISNPTWSKIDVITFFILLWLIHTISFELLNVSYLHIFTNFYSGSFLNNYNFLDDPDITKMYHLFIARTYTYGNGIFACCIPRNPRFVSMSSSITAPWIGNYEELENDLTYNLMVGLQSVTTIHFDHILKWNLANQCCRRRDAVVTANDYQAANRRVYDKEDVRVRYEYYTASDRPYVMEVVFESLAFTLTEFFPTEFAMIRAWSDISAESYASTFEYKLVKFITNSKSGMFFFYTHDGKYLVKSLKPSEFTFFQKIFQDYFHFLQDNPNSFVNKFFGMYRIQSKTRASRAPSRLGAGDGSDTDVCFIVMESIFYSDCDTHKIYDLKGSTKGRELSDKEKQSMKVPVLKDLDFLNDGTQIHIGQEGRDQFVRQLDKDVDFLSSLEIMDYSMLLGIHYREDNTVGRQQKSSSLVKPYMFRYEHGGIAGVGKDSSQIYFCGIIDILQQFNTKKKMESAVKRITANKNEISCVPPQDYANRMVQFLAPNIV